MIAKPVDSLSNKGVPPKKTINLAVPADLLEEFNGLCRHYGHGKQKGMVLSAAMLMFLRSEPKTQGRFLQEIATLEIEAGVKRMMERAQSDPTPGTHRKPGLHLTGETPPKPAEEKTPRQTKSKKQAKAAKKAGKAKRGIKKLPKLDDFR